MLFTSLEFLFFFFPIVWAVNFILPKGVKKYWLLAASLFFYYWGEPAFFLLMIISIIFNYSMGLLLDRLNQPQMLVTKNQENEIATEKSAGHRSNTKKKALFIIALLLNFSALLFFKYIKIIADNFQALFFFWNESKIKSFYILPLAISFYTFQSVSYIIDIYRGMPAEKNPCNYALFIAFFPQLLQGPILRYKDFSSQLENQRITLDEFSNGVIRFLTGFNQKILLANILSELTDKAFGSHTLSVGMAWLGMITYSLQIYLDFSGYSDMAVGLGKMFGFHFPENFDFPFSAANFSDLWRRWHITLAAWFRDYLYIPLGGSRFHSKIRIAINIMIIWLTTALWHGSEITFIIWGLMNGVCVITEKFTNSAKKIENRPAIRFLYRIAVLLIFVYGGMIFRSGNFPQALDYTKSLLKLNGNPWRDNLFIFNFREYLFIITISIFAAFPLVRKLRTVIASHGKQAENIMNTVWFCIQIILAIISLSCLVMNTHNPFLYSNF